MIWAKMKNWVFARMSDNANPRCGAAFVAVIAALLLSACGATARLPVSAGTGTHPQLPEPTSSVFPVVHVAKAKGWPENAAPVALAGTRVNAFARGLVHPRWLYVLPNGDVLVAETNAPYRPRDAGGLRGWFMQRFMKRAGATVPSPDRITLLRDADGDGVAELRTVFLSNLHSPFGMELVGNSLYIANTDALLRFDYVPNATRILTPGEKVLDLPAGDINHHWTKNVIASPDGRQLFVTVGSNSNIAENGLAAEADRASVWLVDPALRSHRIFASGLRNPNGMAWEPSTRKLWVVVNERDELGSDLVPDYMTSIADQDFYGWPYSYFGAHVDSRVTPQRPDMVATARTPGYALGPHTASLGLAFAPAGTLRATMPAGMFVGQHGSWNRKPFSGYKVLFVPFRDGLPAGNTIDGLTGFVNSADEAYGRPVGVALDRSGSLLVADDVGNVIWRVSGHTGSP